MNNTVKRRDAQGRPPASKGTDRRGHILDNALTLFAGQGIAGTSVAQIAKAGGVTPAMVHYYFGNREGLLDALVAERLASALDAIWTGLAAEASAHPRRIITELVDRLLETVDRMPQLPLLWSREILNTGGALRERILKRLPHPQFEPLCRALTEAQQEAALNPRVVPGLVFTSVMSVVMLPLAAQDLLNKVPGVPALDKTLLKQHALALLLDGLCPEHGEENR